MRWSQRLVGGCCRIRLVMAALVAVLACPLAAAALEVNHSWLLDKDGNRAVRDDKFAEWMSILTIEENAGSEVVDVGHATLLFQQCYGGGMLDDLTGALTNAAGDGIVPCVGGSGSTATETANSTFTNEVDRVCPSTTLSGRNEQ